MADTQLEQFHRFLTEQLNNGGSALTPEDCLEKWRAQQRERTATNVGIRRGLEDIRAGRSQHLSEYTEEFRRNNNISGT